MEKTLTDLQNLQVLIFSKWTEYREAIEENKTFEEVKAIYMRIKELEKEADDLMQKASYLKFNKIDSPE